MRTLALALLLSPFSICAAQDQKETERKVAMFPPVVVSTVPVAGAVDVDPDLKEIRVTFSKAMGGGMSWSTAWQGSSPDVDGKPEYSKDKRTCVLPVKLEPGKTYGFWMNSERFKNFRDTEGRPAVPYLFVFQTKPAKK